jgi:hypothetical protein
MRGGMRTQDLERVGLAACLAVALLAPGTSLAISPEKPAAPKSEAVPPSNASEDVGGYAQVLVDPLSIGFTKDFLSNEDLHSQRIQGGDVLRVRRHYREAVAAKLGDAYPIAAEPGPRIVRLEAILIDHVLDKYEWLRPTKVTFRGAPRVRLVALLRDSQTGAVVDTVGLSLKPQPNRMMRDSPGFYWHFMRKVFDRLATRVRWSLEDGARAVSE